jgi:hypothetical protein
MSERDVMALLAAANPIEVGDLSELEFPRPKLARPPRTRTLLLTAMVVAVAATLVAVFAFSGSSSSPQPQGIGPIGRSDLAGPGPTVDRPLPLGGREVSLGDAQAALGVPIVLPDTSPIGSPAVGPVWLSTSGGESVAAVTYPAAGTWVGYRTGANRYYDDVLLLYQAIANEDRASFRVVYIDGTPALAAEENTDQTGGNPSSIMFDAGGAQVTIIGHQTLPKLQALAQSIIVGSAEPSRGQLGNVGGVQLFPSLADAHQIALADASATLGAPVVLPETSVARPSDVGQVWAEGRCPASGATAQDAQDGRACWVWLSFPTVGLTVGYLRPPMYAGTRGEWELQAKQYGNATSVVDLRGVSALAIAPNGPFPGSVEFDLAGTRVVVAGKYAPARLQAVAQSIVDRADS